MPEQKCWAFRGQTVWKLPASYFCSAFPSPSMRPGEAELLWRQLWVLACVMGVATQLCFLVSASAGTVLLGWGLAQGVPGGRRPLHPASQEGSCHALCCSGLCIASPLSSSGTSTQAPVALAKCLQGHPRSSCCPATHCCRWVGVAGLGGGHGCSEPCRRRERQRHSERRAIPHPGASW